MPFGFIGLIIIKKFVLSICVLLKGFIWARTVGRWVYEEDFFHEYKIYQLKLLIEAYLDFAIMSFLNINAWRIYPELNFWGSPWDRVSSVGTIVTAIFLWLYPIYGAIGIYKNLDSLDDDEVIKTFGILYEDQKH